MYNLLLILFLSLSVFFIIITISVVFIYSLFMVVYDIQTCLSSG